MFKRVPPLCLLAGTLCFAFAQDGLAPRNLQQREQPVAAEGVYRVEPGAHILLNMINSISTKTALVGDRIYLETAFPVIANGRIVIPQGSWVTGTITEVKRPGRAKGKGQLQVKFDSIVLPNGSARNFNADIGALDARNSESLKREENKINGPGDKKGDVGTVVRTAEAGTVIGSGIGAASGSLARGAGIGVAGGAAAGLLGVLLTRGPDATLPKGSTVEMVLDRPLVFNSDDVDFTHAAPSRTLSEGSTPQPQSRGFKPASPF
jgi:type IV secretion system protein VirB10